MKSITLVVLLVVGSFFTVFLHALYVLCFVPWYSRVDLGRGIESDSSLIATVVICAWLLGVVVWTAVRNSQ